ncbi:Trp biosynthesis-associated membrane protein [Nocardioides sp.]|uniref:Trp biosynthesis-associated membrane protein n=1 Tax=Nocardioides sp. TaxID=35761 RepID=UPI0031FEE0FB
MVLVGLASGVLAAVSGNNVWAVPDSTRQTGTGAILGVASGTSAEDAARMPLATALALVVLAAWGVLLVTRGRFRRVISFVCVLAALGALATTVVGFVAAPRALRSALTGLGVEGASVHHTAWYWAGLVGALLTSMAAALAVRWVSAWPEMGSRYDAPAAQATAVQAVAEPQEQSSLDLWKAMDEGRDPTE